MLLWMPFRMEPTVMAEYLKSAFTDTNLMQPFINLQATFAQATGSKSQLLAALLTLRAPFMLIISIALDWLLFRSRDELAVRRLPAWAQSLLLGIVLLGLFLMSFSSGQPLLSIKGSDPIHIAIVVLFAFIQQEYGIPYPCQNRDDLIFHPYLMQLHVSFALAFACLSCRVDIEQLAKGMTQLSWVRMINILTGYRLFHIQRWHVLNSTMDQFAFQVIIERLHRCLRI